MVINVNSPEKDASQKIQGSGASGGL